jgi:hypothetical protein
MPGVNQDVVGQIELFQGGNAAQEVWLQQEAIVGFTLYEVPDSEQFWISSQSLQLRATSGDRKSTQPTTPRIQGQRSARWRSHRVSSSVCRV